MIQAWRGALAKINLRLFLGQWLGNAVLMLLAAAWLQVPDSHSWQFAFSLLSGVVLVVVFLSLYAFTFRHLVTCATRPPFWRSCLFVLAAVALWWVAQPLIEMGRSHEGLFAGYWNSQSPKWLRYHLGYSSLVAWQERIYDGIEWIWAGLLLPLAMQFAACGRATRAYRHWFYWALCAGVRTGRFVANLGTRGMGSRCRPGRTDFQYRCPPWHCVHHRHSLVVFPAGFGRLLCGKAAGAYCRTGIAIETQKLHSPGFMFTPV